MGSAPIQRECVATKRSIGVASLALSAHLAPSLQARCSVIKFGQRVPERLCSGAVIRGALVTSSTTNNGAARKGYVDCASETSV